MSLDEVIALLILAIYFGLLALERFRPARAFTEVPRWRWIGLAFLTMLMAINGIVPALLPMDWIAAHALLPGHELGLAGGIVAGVLTTSLVDYGIHRLMHRSALLWRWVHQLHHSASRVDIYGSAYLHPLEVLVFVGEGVAVNVFLLGLTPEAGAIAGLIAAFCAMFQHCNTRTPRWLGWFIQRPEAHLHHHERGVHGWNYSNIPLWDMLFGTWRNPADFQGEVGFAGDRGRRIGAMLRGVDVHADDQTLPYLANPAAAQGQAR